MSHFSSCVCVCVCVCVYIFYFLKIFFLKEFDERLGNVTFIDPCNQCTHSRQLPNINDYMKVLSLQVIGHRND